MFLDLQALLDDVVEDESNEDELASHDEVVPGRHVPQQLHRPEVGSGYDPAGRRKLEGQPNVRK